MIIYIQISNFDIDPREKKKKKDDEMNHFKYFVVNTRERFQSEIEHSINVIFIVEIIHIQHFNRLLQLNSQ